MRRVTGIFEILGGVMLPREKSQRIVIGAAAERGRAVWHAVSLCERKVLVRKADVELVVGELEDTLRAFEGRLHLGLYVEHAFHVSAEAMAYVGVLFP